MSNYADLSFSDEKVIAICLFGAMDKHGEIKGIYEYAESFARLPSYVAYVQRLNRVAGVFAPLLARIQQEQENKNPWQVWLIDSFPAVKAPSKAIGLTRV